MEKNLEVTVLSGKKKKAVPITPRASQVVLVVKNLPSSAGDARDVGSSP